MFSLLAQTERIGVVRLRGRSFCFGHTVFAARRIVLLFAATFLPTLGLGLAAHFHALSWQRANSMLIFSLLLPGFSFVLGARHKRERS